MRGWRGVLAALWLLTALPALAQEAANDPGQPSGTISVAPGAATDSAIRQRITAILSQVPAFDQVDLRVDSGIVTLTGSVVDNAAIDRLDRLVARVDGVVDIENQVTEAVDLGTRLGSAGNRFKARLEQTIAYLPLLGIALGTALLIGLFGGWLARRRRPWDRIAPNPFIAEVLRQIVRLVAWVTAIVVALDILGATALLGTFIGAAGIIGIALGFAVRDTVENFIASILLSLRQPFRPNDLVDIEGHQGRVIRLTGRATTLLSNDGNHIRIPNSTVFKAMITNYTRHPERRFSFDLGVDASADLAALRDLAMQTLSGLDFVLPSPAPAVWVEQVGDSNVVMRFTGWVKQNGVDFNLARGEAIRIIKDVLEKAGFGLPEPIYRLRIDGPDTGTPAPLPAPVTDTAPPADIRPDDAINQLVQEGKHDGGTDLLSPHAPQE